MDAPCRQTLQFGGRIQAEDTNHCAQGGRRTSAFHAAPAACIAAQRRRCRTAPEPVLAIACATHCGCASWRAALSLPGSRPRNGKFSVLYFVAAGFVNNRRNRAAL
jgi:hypothetical protein